MKPILLFSFCFCAIAFVNPGCNAPAPKTETNHNESTDVIPEDFMYQYSIIDALLAGVYDGNMTFDKLKQKGDFGVGSFNRLDGELIMNEGKVYACALMVLFRK